MNTSTFSMKRAGPWWRELRHRRELTQAEVAAFADVDPAYIYRLELGMQTPRIDVVVRIAAALGVDVATLLDPPRRMTVLQRMELEKMWARGARVTTTKEGAHAARE